MLWDTYLLADFKLSICTDTDCITKPPSHLRPFKVHHFLMSNRERFVDLENIETISFYAKFLSTLQKKRCQLILKTSSWYCYSCLLLDPINLDTPNKNFTPRLLIIVVINHTLLILLWIHIIQYNLRSKFQILLLRFSRWSAWTCHDS